MLIYYAPGGGLGHLSRALKVLGFIKAQQALVITSPLPLAVDTLLPKGIQHISLPTRLQSRAELSAWLKQLLASLNKQQACRLMLIDAFPGGIWGELGDIPCLANLSISPDCSTGMSIASALPIFPVFSKSGFVNGRPRSRNRRSPIKRANASGCRYSAKTSPKMQPQMVLKSLNRLW